MKNFVTKKWLFISCVSAVLVLVLVAGFIIHSSRDRREKSTRQVDETVASDTIDMTELTIKPTPGLTSTPTPTPKPTPKPTAKPTPRPTQIPTPTPTPFPTSVYIPREESADGALFDTSQYLILPGEGESFQIFDAYGKFIDSFSYIIGGDVYPVGLFREEEMDEFIPFTNKPIQAVEISGDEFTVAYDANYFRNGAYQWNHGDGKYLVIIYNQLGEPIKDILIEQDDENTFLDSFIVDSYKEDIVVCVSMGHMDPRTNKYSVTTEISYLSQSGEVLRTLCINDHVDAFFGDSYWTNNYYYGNLYDFDGNLIEEEVSFGVLENNQKHYYYTPKFPDYFVKNGKYYDTGLREIPNGTVNENGTLIEGMKYDVDSMECEAKYAYDGSDFYYSWYTQEDLIAIGKKYGTIAIKTRYGEYSFAKNSNEFFCGINKYYCFFRIGETEQINVYSLLTKEKVATIECDMYGLEISDEYIIATLSEENPNSFSYNTKSVVYDKNFSPRYIGENVWIESLPGELMLVHRGPYVGITDLNGEWLIKSLDPDIARDTTHPAYYTPW